MSDQSMLERAAEKARAGLANVFNMAKSPIPGNEPIGPGRPSGTYEGALPRRETSEPLSPQAMRELHPRVIPAPDPNLLAAWPTPTPATIHAVAELCGFTADKATLAKIEGLQVRFEAAQADVMAHTYGAARRDWQEHTASELAKLNLREADTFSMEEFVEDYSRKCSAAKQRCAAIANEAIELLKPLAAQFNALTSDTADEIDQATEARCRSIAVSFRPSDYAMWIRKAGYFVNETLKTMSPTCGMPPKTIAAFLPI